MTDDAGVCEMPWCDQPRDTYAVIEWERGEVTLLGMCQRDHDALIEFAEKQREQHGIGTPEAN